MAARLLALMLVGMAGAAIGANGVESLFFARFGPDFLPYLYLLLGPLTFGVMAGMSTLLSGQAARVLSRLPVALAATLLAARGVLALELRWFYPVLWLVMMVAWTCQVMGSWGLAGTVSDTRQAKRLFPLYGAGLITGGVLGGLLTGPIAAAIHAENLLFVWAGALLAAHAVARTLAGTTAARRRRRRGPRMARELADGFRDVWTWPLLRWMSVSLILLAILYFTLSLLFAEAATARYPRADELAGFLGLFMGVTNGAALVVSLLVANRLFARFGLPTMVMALAAIYVAGFGALALTSAFAALLAFRFVQMVWVNGVWATGWQALFNVVPAERRARTRTFMDAGPLQTGIVLAGGLLLLADRVLEPAHLAVVGAVAGALALGAMWRARRAYAGALVEALRTGNPDVFRSDEEPFGGFRDDADVRQVVRSGVGDPDPATRRISTAILSGLAVPEDVPVLRAALTDDDPHVRSAAVRGLARADAGPEVVRGLLEDPDPVVRAAAAAVAGGEGAEATLAAMARDPREEWRAAAAGALGSAGRAAELATLLGDRESEVRSAAARALASVPADLAVRPLAAALGDPDESVRSSAAAALASIGTAAEDALVAALHEPDSRHAALRALAAIGGPPPPALIAFAHDRAERAARYQRLWLGLSPGTDDRIDLLAAGLRHRATTIGLEALRAVARSGDPEAMAIAAENLTGSDPQQRANALETMEALGRADVVRPLLALWEGSRPVGGGEGEVVEELLGDDDPWLRACAALAAGALDRPDLRPVLQALRDDADELVRHSAEVALEPVETLSTLSLLERVMFLSKVRLFADLPPEDLKRVAEAASEHAFPDGEVIAEQDEPGDEMHVVVSGQIRVLVGRDGGPPAEVARRAAGETVGEMAILGEESRMASLVCAGSVRTLALDRRSFRRILRERPDVSLAVMRVLSERLRQAHGEP